MKRVLANFLMFMFSACAHALAQTPSFISTAPMNVGRVFHTATALNNGNVLVTGGFSSRTAAENTAEVYVPSSGAWHFTAAPMLVARSAACSVLLPDGRALIIGGLDAAQNSVLSAEIFDPDPTAETFQLTGQMHAAHQVALSPSSCLLLDDGRAIVISGLRSGGAVEIFDPATNSWQQVAGLGFERINSAAVLLADGRVAIFGGQAGDGGPALANVTVYDVSLDRWTELTPLSAPRVGGTATFLPNGKLIIAGGFHTFQGGSTVAAADTEIYDPTGSGTTVPAPNLNFPRYVHTATPLPNGDVLLVGGQNSTGSFFRFFVMTGEVFNTTSGTWTRAGTLNFGRSAHSATLLNSGEVLVVGGVTDPTFGGPGIGAAELWNSGAAVLMFPLHGQDPDSAKISSVFDHNVPSDAQGPRFYSNDRNGIVTAYTGEEGVRDCGLQECTEPNFAQAGIFGYKNTDGLDFFINGAYTGGRGCLGGSCSRWLFYDGHPGFDYPAELRTQIFAPAAGRAFIPDGDPITSRSDPSGAVDGYNVLAIDHSNGYSTWYLHLGNAATGEDFRIVECPGQPPITLRKGDGQRVPVTTDCIVGRVGNKTPSGAISPHLHFEVRKGLANFQCILPSCAPVDPYGWDDGSRPDPYPAGPNVRLWK